MDDEKRKTSCTTDGKPPREGFENASAPAPLDPETGQHESYWVLCEDERRKGFVRPVRRSYRHEKCGTVTTMSQPLAETIARDPSYYGATFCCACRGHFPLGEFTWTDDGTEMGS